MTSFILIYSVCHPRAWEFHCADLARPRRAAPCLYQCPKLLYFVFLTFLHSRGAQPHGCGCTRHLPLPRGSDRCPSSLSRGLLRPALQPFYSGNYKDSLPRPFASSTSLFNRFWSPLHATKPRYSYKPGSSFHPPVLRLHNYDGGPRQAPN